MTNKIILYVLMFASGLFSVDRHFGEVLLLKKDTLNSPSYVVGLGADGDTMRIVKVDSLGVTIGHVDSARVSGTADTALHTPDSVRAAYISDTTKKFGNIAGHGVADSAGGAARLGGQPKSYYDTLKNGIIATKLNISDTTVFMRDGQPIAQSQVTGLTDSLDKHADTLGKYKDHTNLNNLNSANYTHLTATNHTDLTDGGLTTLHAHDSVRVSGNTHNYLGDSLHLYKNNAETTPALTIEQDGTGDAVQKFKLTGGQEYAVGIDNSNGDYLKIHPFSLLSNNTGFNMNGTGHIGINVAPNTYTSLRVEDTITTSNGYGARIGTTFIPSGLGDLYGIFTYTYLAGSDSVDQFYNARFSSYFTSNSNVMRRFEGFDAYSEFTGSTMSIVDLCTMFQIRATRVSGGLITVGNDLTQLWLTNTAGVFDVGGISYGIRQDAPTYINYFAGAIQIASDANGLEVGAAQDGKIHHDGTNMIINPKVVGSGYLDVLGNLHSDSLTIKTMSDTTGLLFRDSTDSVVKPSKVVYSRITYDISFPHYLLSPSSTIPMIINKNGDSGAVLISNGTAGATDVDDGAFMWAFGNDWLNGAGPAGNIELHAGTNGDVLLAPGEGNYAKVDGNVTLVLDIDGGAFESGDTALQFSAQGDYSNIYSPETPLRINSIYNGETYGIKLSRDSVWINGVLFGDSSFTTVTNAALSDSSGKAGTLNGRTSINIDTTGDGANTAAHNLKLNITDTIPYVVRGENWSRSMNHNVINMDSLPTYSTFYRYHGTALNAPSATTGVGLKIQNPNATNYSIDIAGPALTSSNSLYFRTQVDGVFGSWNRMWTNQNLDTSVFIKKTAFDDSIAEYIDGTTNRMAMFTGAHTVGNAPCSVGTNVVIFDSALTTKGKITSNVLTAQRAVITDPSLGLVSATTTATEIGYVNGVTSAIQTQLNAKLNNTNFDDSIGHYLTSATVACSLFSGTGFVSAGTGKIARSGSIFTIQIPTISGTIDEDSVAYIRLPSSGFYGAGIGQYFTVDVLQSSSGPMKATLYHDGTGSALKLSETPDAGTFFSEYITLYGTSVTWRIN